MVNENENQFSDDERDYDPKKHKQLLQSIGRLAKTQYIEKPSRSEPVLKQDEFHLSKTRKISEVKVKDTSVSVNDLVTILNKSNTHVNVGKELKTTQRNKKVLPKPLEKPVADRIQRSIGYGKTKLKLKKWDPIVAKNRLSDHQVFPLDYEEIHVDTTLFSKKRQSIFSIKSELQIEMEALEEKLKLLKGVTNETVNEVDLERKIQQNLTRKELIAKRRELAYLRLQQSQKSAKERLHNKIKSKKFHKLLKKEKLKEQLKQFELLQKTNPEAAIEQLEKLEKNRVLERANLRHKNTGTWAKNLQVRAKYDKDVRKDLTEQLTISRELTQKHHEMSDDENKESDEEMNEEKNEENEDVDPFNPWIKVNNKKKNSNEKDEVLTGYKKYWLERNENEKAMQEYKKLFDDNKNDVENAKSSDEENVEDEISKFREILVNQQDPDKTKSLKRKSKDKIIKKLNTSNNEKKLRRSIENGWIVEEIQNSDSYKNDKNSKLLSKNINDIFDEAEDNVEEKISKKIKNMKDIFKKIDETKKGKKNGKNKDMEKDELENLKKLSFKNTKQRPDFDEELNELPVQSISEKENNQDLNLNRKILNENQNLQDSNDLIDPNNFANIKPKRLHTIINTENPDSAGLFEDEIGDGNEMDPELSTQMVIAEAFEDDDVIADFTKEKEDQNKGDNEIDLSMPGWGSWAGSGINNKNKRRLVLKFPEKEKRRDENKGNLYINENENNQLKEHLVSDLPFPFINVKDYEASIRAPLGRTFVPETAFRVLTRPAVETKMGHIIEPMNTSILVKKPITRRKHVVDARVETMLRVERDKKKK